MRGERSHHAQNAQGPAWAGCTHLAAGASSPSQFGPSPHPQGPSCHQSSCRLRACKRLQQMWGGGGEESPESPLVRTGPSSAVATSPPVPSRHSHSHAHQTARQLTARPTLSQTREGPAPSRHLPPFAPQSPLGGKTMPNCHPLGS